MTQKHRAKPRKKPRKDAAAPGPGSDRGARTGPAPRKKGTGAKGQDGVWLYGRHAVAAALANPDRKINRVFATKNAADWLKDHGAAGAALARLEDIKPDDIDRLLHDGAVHQGLAALAEDLPRARLEDVCAPAEKHAPVLVLDQITDPQNIGALFRSAAAFGAKAVIVQDRRTPPLSGALAKAAAGAIEVVPCIEVVNIARAIEALQAMGYFCAGLAGEAQTEITALPDAPLALVMGAEGAGLRRLVAEKCDQLFRIPIAPGVESLNVSTAAAISLYEARRPRQDRTITEEKPMSKPVLYYCPRTRADTTMWMNLELGDVCDIEIVNLKSGAHKSPDFVKINPMGKVPALVHDGVVVTESAAICAYLADAFADKGFSPALTDPKRGAWYRWILYAPSCIEPMMLDKLGGVKRENAMSAGYGTEEDVLKSIDVMLSDGPYILGDRVSAADIVMGSLLNFAIMFGAIEKQGKIADYVDRMTARPAFAKTQEISAKHAADLGL